MSDTTDMMLDGTLCQECGELMPDMRPTTAQLKAAPKKNGIPMIDDIEPPGYPRSCEDCKPTRKSKRRKR